MSAFDDLMMKRKMQSAASMDAVGGATAPTPVPAPSADAEAAHALVAQSKPKDVKVAQRKVAAVEDMIQKAPEAAPQIIAQEAAKPAMSRGDKIATALIAVLPTLIGSVAQGAEGGAIGAGVSINALDGMKKEYKEADATARTRFEKDRERNDEFAKQDKQFANQEKLTDKELAARAREGALSRASAREVAQISAEGRDSKRNLDLESKLRTELTGSDAYKNYEKISGFTKNIEEARKSGNAFGDLATIYDFMKTVDPTSVVRESEGKMFLDSTSLGDRFKNSAEQLMNGKRLRDDQYKAIMDVIEARKKAAHSAYKDYSKVRLNVAGREKIDPSYIDPLYSVDSAQAPAQQAPVMSERQRLNAARAAIKGK